MSIILVDFQYTVSRIILKKKIIIIYSASHLPVCDFHIERPLLMASRNAFSL